MSPRKSHEGSFATGLSKASLLTDVPAVIPGILRLLRYLNAARCRLPHQKTSFCENFATINQVPFDRDC